MRSAVKNKEAFMGFLKTIADRVPRRWPTKQQTQMEWTQGVAWAVNMNKRKMVSK
jgi:hypothetical protein